jgi:anaerobic selenocysteine-containing dehydrogenase
MTRRTVRTMCPMNCHPTLCGMLAEVEDGKLLSVAGDPDNPDSRGFLCVRGQASREIIGNPTRLLRPLMRDRARRRDEKAFREATWQEALDFIAGGMKAAGREAVGFWSGHGAFSNNYGTRINAHLMRRFANLWGCQWWHPTMICWGLGAVGAAITGALETNTKEDMGENSKLILLWGANLASQPNTAPHLKAAKRRGAYVVTIDVRRTEAAAQSDEVLLIRPGSDAALALAMMHVIVGEGLHDREFVAEHTLGFDELSKHLLEHSPAWAEPLTGIPASQIAALARRYAGTHPAMIVLGGSSMHKGANGWQGARAVTCLPALTGQLGVAGGGLGPRHGSRSHGQGLNDITCPERRPAGNYIASQMPHVTEALLDDRLKVMMLFGTDMLSSYADAGKVAEGLARADLVVAHDLFMNDTARRCADVVLPSTAWLEELGAKATNTHLYLMEQALEAPGETRTVSWVLRELAARLGIDGFHPWKDDAALIDALIDHPATGNATVAALRAEGGMRALRISHVAHPDRRFPTPSGKLELFSAQARKLGLPELPVFDPLAAEPAYPLAFRQGRTLTQFHAFYDQGRALPTLARLDPVPQLWLSPADAAARGLANGAAIRVYNDRGEMRCQAHVTDRVPAGTVWMRDGWAGLNGLTSGRAVLPDAAVEAFGFSGGQAGFDAAVEVARA